MTEDLYKEVPCKRCGQKKLAIASFCPHCGEIVSESWIESVVKRFRSDGGAEGKSINIVPVLVGLIVAGYFLYTAIERESIQGLIIALLSLFFVFRSMFSGSKRSVQSNSGSEPSVHEAENAPDDPFSDKFFCENCGTKVPGDASECPKCGMKFG